MKNRKAFTLIELVSVLVILAILALIVTPLVLNIIRKARTAADKRSIDAYGRSIELAIADYLLDNGAFPTSIDQLTIEYSGDRVVCSTTQLNSDSSVYLAECKVNNRGITGYTYGTDKTPAAPTYTAYSVGDEVSYNNVDYYVIKESSTSEANVTLLKVEPLSYEEVQTYSDGTGAQISNKSSYGGTQYGTISTYSTSYIKQIVDVWGTNYAEEAAEVRLITIDELIENFAYELQDRGSSIDYAKTEDTPNWVYNENYAYWTMSQYNDSENYVWWVATSGSINEYGGVTANWNTVRPVIVISKSVLN